MDRYSLIVEQFNIHHTRALHHDTLWLNVSAFVDGDLVDSWSDNIGDFNNGTYFTPQSVHDHPPTVINDPQSKVQFIFQLMNNGNVPSGQLSGRAAATADQLSGITSNLAENVAGLAAAVGSGYILGRDRDRRVREPLVMARHRLRRPRRRRPGFRTSLLARREDGERDARHPGDQ
jgi:hypothetical protein